MDSEEQKGGQPEEKKEVTERDLFVQEMCVLDVELKRLESIQEDEEKWMRYTVDERNLRLTLMNAISAVIGMLMLVVNSWRDPEAQPQEATEETKEG